MIVNYVKQNPYKFGPDYSVCQTAQYMRDVGTILTSVLNKSSSSANDMYRRYILDSILLYFQSFYYCDQYLDRTKHIGSV